MLYEVLEVADGTGAAAAAAAWRVEAIDYDGDGTTYAATFTGPGAEERAKEYARWKNRGVSALTV